MTIDQLNQFISTICPGKGGRDKFAHLLDVDPSTVRRWQTGQDIPKAIEFACQWLAQEKRLADERLFVKNA